MNHLQVNMNFYPFKKKEIVTFGSGEYYQIMNVRERSDTTYRVVLIPYRKNKNWFSRLTYRIKFFFLDNYLGFVYNY